MAYIVVYDACILHPAPLRDLLVRIAQAGVVRARWSEPILDECFASILRRRPELRPDALKRTRRLMMEAVPDCLVLGFAGLIDGLTLPDPDDRYVLAAAIKIGGQAIVTANVRDFPSKALAPYGLEAKHPDDFVLEMIHLAPELVVQVVTEQSAALRSPRRSVDGPLTTLHGAGVVRSAARLRKMMNASGAGGPIR